MEIYETLLSSGIVADRYRDRWVTQPVHRICFARQRPINRYASGIDPMTCPINSMVVGGIIQWKQSFSEEKKRREEDPEVKGIIDLAKMYNTIRGGFRLEDDHVICPVVVIKESDDLSFEMAELNISFGNATRRPMMMTQISMKMDILSKMQGRSVNDICRDQCDGVLVRLKGIECLVLISLKATDMRLENEMENGISSPRGHYADESIALCRCLDVLVRLAPYIHTFDNDGVLYAFRTPVVVGNSQRVTKSQVRVSKLLWRGIFDGHPVLMAPSLVNRVF
jgi:hypothetical protein